MPSHNQKGRSKKLERYVKIEHYIMKTKAWAELSPRDVRIWLLLCYRYNGFNNGKIALSLRDAAKHGKMNQGTASKSIARLIELGFIKRTFGGSFSQKQSLASEFALTSEKVGDKLATKEFTRWRPPKKPELKERQPGINLGAMTNKGVV